ncbi:DUF4126 domain-containing protein [Desulfosoma caldarium]|uniref:Uncharacterized protein DUF4126 n=1 Tax=Desulfosoma caldarium TaxID=610254 RepID=A0A3N1VMY4_9BACT|nr:DUF4126 domain-containing protein [Desulfosoma caldarium]ROR03310.1 uncharacterized protein DUF4126 [Desulfosoma caldarium]
MDAIAQLGSLLGLSFICGVNLYATVAVVGLCLKHGLVHGLPVELSVLANDAVIFVAVVLYVVEFVIDKIPGMDTLWDALHTVIRPLGGALLAVLQVGEGSPALEVIAFMIGASLASAAHLTKVGTRLLVQASPEPFSNTVLSVGEDLFAIGYAYMSLSHPRWTFFLTLLLVAGVLLVLPMLCRVLFMGVRALGHRIGSAFGARLPLNPPKDLPLWVQVAFETVRQDGEEILWASRAYALRVPGVPRYASVHMILSNRAATLFYQKFFRKRHLRLLKDHVTRTSISSGKFLSACFFHQAGSSWGVAVYRNLAQTLPSSWVMSKEP